MSENMSNNELVEVDEINEDNIELLVDYSPIVKEIGVVKKDGNFGTTYFYCANIEGLGLIKSRIKDESVVNFLNLCKKLNVEATKSKTLVRECSKDKNKVYTSIKVVFRDDKIFRFFVGRADESSLDLLFEIYNSKKKN